MSDMERARIVAFAVGFMYEWAKDVHADHESPAEYAIPALIELITKSLNDKESGL